MNEQEKCHRRIRRVKRFLKLLPRKALLEKYPVIGRFAEPLRRNAFLWSFRSSEVFPAFLSGWVVTLTPFYGMHTILAVVAAFLFRANLLVMLALQLISNPFVEPFIWLATHAVGQFAISVFGNTSVAAANTMCGSGIMRWLATATLGSILLGFFLAIISCGICGLLTKADQIDKRKN
ncbi:MAG: DUF2062 domain-containing protein [Puniceicoccales bacterium]|nr:DUF2062 domain-containing protein [Puniceicoccales bacterium]